MIYIIDLSLVAENSDVCLLSVKSNFENVNDIGLSLHKLNDAWKFKKI